MSARPILAILHHESDEASPTPYLIGCISEEWEKLGFTVKKIYGTKKRIAADAMIVHIDASVVPEEYLDFARHYPRVINVGISDISKRTCSTNLVSQDPGYGGAVIVKTSHNSAGAPELNRRRLPHKNNLLLRAYWKLFGDPAESYPYRIRSKDDYRIYNALAEVPQEIFNCPDLVVEKFSPERVGEKYLQRKWYFLGESEFYSCEISEKPIFTVGTYAPERAIAPPQAIREVRTRLKMDYGKIDYAIADGRPVLFDVNKTMGVGSPRIVYAEILAETLATGIFAYFPELRPTPALLTEEQAGAGISP